MAIFVLVRYFTEQDPPPPVPHQQARATHDPPRLNFKKNGVFAGARPAPGLTSSRACPLSPHAPFQKNATTLRPSAAMARKRVLPLSAAPLLGPPPPRPPSEASEPNTTCGRRRCAPRGAVPLVPPAAGSAPHPAPPRSHPRPRGLAQLSVCPLLTAAAACVAGAAARGRAPRRTRVRRRSTRPHRTTPPRGRCRSPVGTLPRGTLLRPSSPSAPPHPTPPRPFARPSPRGVTDRT